MATRSIFKLDFLDLITKNREFQSLLVRKFPDCLLDYCLAPTNKKLNVYEVLTAWIQDNPENIRHSESASANQLLEKIKAWLSSHGSQKSQLLNEIHTNYIECIIDRSNPNYPLCFFFYLTAMSPALRTDFLNYHLKSEFDNRFDEYKSFLEEGIQLYLAGHHLRVQPVIFDPVIYLIKAWLPKERTLEVSKDNNYRVTPNKIEIFFKLLNQEAKFIDKDLENGKFIDKDLVTEMAELVKVRGRYKKITFINTENPNFNKPWSLFVLMSFLEAKGMIALYNGETLSKYITANFSMIKDGKVVPIPERTITQQKSRINKEEFWNIDRPVNQLNLYQQFYYALDKTYQSVSQ